MKQRIKVVVSGANGRMGREVVKAVLQDEGLELVGATDPKMQGIDVGLNIGLGETGVLFTGNLRETLRQTGAEVMVDFTNPQSVIENIKISLEEKVYPVVGTTGINPEHLEEIGNWSRQHEMGAFIAPNFALGAVLMMKFAQEAAKYLPYVEIIELHHDQKLDAPSGTAVKTAEMISTTRQVFRQGNKDEYEKYPGSRGGEYQGMRIHSVRLPGLVAHQEVLFGGLGQTLSIRHDSISRESFMPGVLLAVHKVKNLKGVVYGLENLLND